MTNEPVTKVNTIEWCSFHLSNLSYITIHIGTITIIIAIKLAPP
jgi:hypothetical protein